LFIRRSKRRQRFAQELEGDKMNKKQVINKIGKENWKDFLIFMRGQTIGFDKGIADYYDCDVDCFISKLNSENKN